MASDAIRRFLGPAAKPLAEAETSPAQPAVVSQPVAGLVPGEEPDVFALLEAKYGKAVADQARAQVANQVATTVDPVAAVIPAGIGESLVHMKLPERPHKADPVKIAQANRRFMPPHLGQDGLTIRQ